MAYPAHAGCISEIGVTLSFPLDKIDLTGIFQSSVIERKTIKLWLLFLVARCRSAAAP
jgi:hypothetical protein